MRELQMWCPAPPPKGELQRRKLRSDKYKPPAGRLLENYESDSSVEADEDTGDEAEGGDVGASPDAGGSAKVRRRTTRSAVGKQSASATAAAAVKAAEKKKKRKRREASPLAVVTHSIRTPRSREVGSDEEEEESEKEKDETVVELPVHERPARWSESPTASEKDETVVELPVHERPASWSESPTAKRQQELVQKTSEDALRRGLEAQRSAIAAQARVPATIKPLVFWPKARLAEVTR
jgi:hypothetical protein